MKETSSHEEIRPGRTVYHRQMILPFESSSSSSSSSSSLDKTQEQQKIDAKILFVHGSCASCDQYDSLLASLSNLILVTNNGKEEEEEEEEEKEEAAGRESHIKRIECHLFDFPGFGQSHRIHEKSAYAHEELLEDLKTMLFSLLQPPSKEDAKEEEEQNQGETDTKIEKFIKNTPVYIVAHSYATSQTLHVLSSILSTKNNVSSSSSNNNINNKTVLSSLKGLIFLSGSLQDAPKTPMKNGGHVIFYLPTFLLSFMQSFLSKAFVQQAISNHNESLKQEALGKSNSNDMDICKYFYRQTKWCTSVEVNEIRGELMRMNEEQQLPVLVIHGEEDGIIPVENGQHLYESLTTTATTTSTKEEGEEAKNETPSNDGGLMNQNDSKFVVLSKSSHQVMEERPDDVARYIFDFLRVQTPIYK